MLKYYYYPGSCAVAAHILLVDSGMAFESIIVDIRSVAPWSEEFVRLNPKRQVPFLEVEAGYVITENIAIQSYIQQAAPDKEYFGSTEREVLRSYEWLAFLSGPLHAAAYNAFYKPQRWSDDEIAVPSIKARGRRKIEECYRYIESRIGEREPLLRVQAVDAYLFVFFRWGNGIGIDMKGDFPRYYARMVQFSQFPSVKQAMADEGIELLVDAGMRDKTSSRS